MLSYIYCISRRATRAVRATRAAGPARLPRRRACAPPAPGGTGDRPRHPRRPRRPRHAPTWASASNRAVTAGADVMLVTAGALRRPAAPRRSGGASGRHAAYTFWISHPGGNRIAAFRGRRRSASGAGRARHAGDVGPGRRREAAEAARDAGTTLKSLNESCARGSRMPRNLRRHPSRRSLRSGPGGLVVSGIDPGNWLRIMRVTLAATPIRGRL